MCGLAGVLRVHDPDDGPVPHHLEAIPEAWLDVLDESIRHRGPDGQARFRDRAVREDGLVVDVALVHRRLSIIDHAGGHQPMVHDGERLRPDLTYQPGETPRVASEIEPDKPLIAVVFNGCIYNHRELRTELESLGHVFETDHSDTEVLLASAVEWNQAIALHLEGMYAYAIWDRLGGTLSIQRDAFGEKPLYHTDQSERMTAFSSCISGITALGWSESGEEFPEADSYLRGWIRFGWNQVPPMLSRSSTVFISSGIRLGANEAEPELEMARGPLPSALEVPTGQIAASEVDHLLRKAVHARLEADVAVGCFLSGGIDSALIACYAREAHECIRCFTVRMPVANYDESGDASETASHLRLNHTVLDCDPEPAADLVMLIEQLGLPFGDSSLLPTYWVSSTASEHVKVALAGDGGDELFLGYDRHRVLDRFGWLPECAAGVLAGTIPIGRNPKSAVSKLSRLHHALAGAGYKDLVAIFPRPFDGGLGLSHTPGHTWHFGMTQGFLAGLALRFDRCFYLPEDLLRKTDTASMASGLEVRCPFLDTELSQHALRADLRALMPGGEQKGLLKQVARRYLPDTIVNRPKRGFAIPIGDWFRTDFGGLRTLLYDHLESAEPFPGLAEAGVELNMSFVRRMLREHDAAGEKSINPWHGRDHSQRLYMLLVLSIWSKWLAGLNRSPGADRGV